MKQSGPGVLDQPSAPACSRTLTKPEGYICTKFSTLGTIYYTAVLPDHIFFKKI